MTPSHSLTRDTAGATSVEYAAIASLLSIVAIGAMAAIGSAVTSLFGSIPAF